VHAVTPDFLVVAESAIDLVGRVEVAQRWSDPSALPLMSVGALAAHLGQQVQMVHAAVTGGQSVTDDPPVSLLEHYARARWVDGDLDSDANVDIRAGAEQAALVGHDALVRSLEDQMRDLRRAFGRSSFRRPPGIRLPSWSWALTFEDFVLTRVMELVVHSDDLAVSVDVDAHPLPESVLGPVLALLVGVSLRRNGQAAVVRALTRRERAPGSISAF
jgi:Mycothiol maleylpyruvate isomerase N-terminal domain